LSAQRLTDILFNFYFSKNFIWTVTDCYSFMYSLTYGAQLAQTIERQTRNARVAGSKPTSGAKSLVSIFYLLQII